MITSYCYRLLVIFLLVFLIDDSLKTIAAKFPLIFYFHLDNHACKKGLPHYLHYTINQAVYTQSESFDIYFISTFNKCVKFGKNIHQDLHLSDVVIKVDADNILSNKTKNFLMKSHKLFSSHSNLWKSSALRFFAIEDFMMKYNYSQAIQIESDNMLYFPLANHILPNLQNRYPRLAATALSRNLVTASFFWIGHITALQDFTLYINDLVWNTTYVSSPSSSSSLASSTNVLMDYVRYLYQSGETKIGSGVFCNLQKKDMCIKPFAVSEMSMLAFYHLRNTSQLQFLPLIPRNIPDATKYKKFLFSEYIDDVASIKALGGGTGENAVFDSGSYGQYLGGTYKFHGHDLHTIDGSHIVGEAIKKAGCIPVFMCNNGTIGVSSNNDSDSRPHFQLGQCRMNPFVKCRGQNVYTPLVNIHVHSKHSSKFVDVECNCSIDNLGSTSSSTSKVL